MDTAAEYRVVFSGHILKGFETQQVRQALSRQFSLDEPQVEQLFRDQTRHILVRTRSQEDAQRYVLRLAKLGAVAQIESGATPPEAAPSDTGPAPKAKTKKTTEEHTLPKYSPLPRSAPFAPLLYGALTLEGLLILTYLLLMLGVFIGTFVFSLGENEALEYPLLALALKVILLPLGSLVLFLLAKPLLSLYSHLHRGIRLPVRQEPDLYLFVHDLCQRLELTPPVEIRLNNDVAAEMYHCRGPLGFWRDETVLTLGLPLLASLNTSQLSALIAQTMLTFRGRRQPRATFLLMSLNRWQHHTVYGEDVLDRALKRWRDQGRIPPALIDTIEGLFTVTRRVFLLRLQFSRTLERRLVHRIVAEADKHALTLAGSEGFSHLLEQERLLEHAMQEELKALQQQWSEQGELPDDWLEPLLQRYQRYPASEYVRVNQQHEHEKAATGDIIPSDAQRVKSVSQQHLAPGYHCLSPARGLLRYFPKLARAMTLRLYNNRLGLPVTPDRIIHPVTEGSVEHQSDQVLERFFLGLWHPLAPLELKARLAEKHSADEARNKWQAARKLLEQHKRRASQLRGEFVEAEEARIESSLKETLYRAEQWRKVGEDKPNKQELEQFYRICRDNDHAADEALKTLPGAYRPFAERLTAAIAMLNFSSEADNQATKHYKMATSLIDIYDRIEGVLPSMRELKLHTGLLQVLLSYRGRINNSKLNDRIAEQAADIRQILTSIGVALKGQANPFPAPRGDRTLMKHLLFEAYTDETPEGDFDRGNDVVERLTLMQKRILARLIVIAEEVEKKLS